jgi:hypothetical protein
LETAAVEPAVVHWHLQEDITMLDNEYMLQFLARERIREAQARATLYSALLKATPGERPARDRRRRLALWWHVTVARATQLTLPKLANRL